MDGNYFGEIELLVPDQSALCTVIAVEPSEIYFLSKSDFSQAMGLINQFPEIVQRIQHHIDRNMYNIRLIEEMYGQMNQERQQALAWEKSLRKRKDFK